MIKNFASIKTMVFALVVTSYVLAISTILVLSALEHSRNINKHVMHLDKEIKAKQARLQSFYSQIIKATLESQLDNLSCKERIKLKFDIIKAMYSINPWLEGPLQKEALYFEDKVFKDKDSCAKNFYNKVALDEIQEKITTQLSHDLKKQIKELNSFKLSMFYTNVVEC